MLRGAFRAYVNRSLRQHELRHLGNAFVPASTWSAALILLVFIAATGRVVFLLGAPDSAIAKPGAPGAASVAVSLSPTGGTVGRTILVSGTGFSGGETITLTWDTIASKPLVSTRATTSGVFSTQMPVPNATSGTHTVIATGASSKRQASAVFTVIPSLSRTPTGGLPGTRVTVTARGFGAGENVLLFWKTATGSLLGTIRTDSAGTGSIVIVIPESTSGWTDYTGYGESSKVRAYGAIRVRAGVSLDPASAAPKSMVRFAGRGLPPGERATVTWNPTTTGSGITLCTGVTNETGSISCDFSVPQTGAGAFPVTITTSGGTTLSAHMKVTGPTALTVSPGNGGVGVTITAIAGGFSPGETVNVSWDNGASVQPVKADVDGAIIHVATVPLLAAGQHVVRAEGETSRKSASSPFTVAATPVAGSSGRISTGAYTVYATREGLVGGTTSSGHKIVADDFFVSLPACTTTNCPGGPFWGNTTNCGNKCYVKVINPQLNACRVEPILDTGPWFRVDDWWNPTEQRYLNNLRSNPNILAQGNTGADAARNGLNVGYGIGPHRIGYDDTGTSPGRPLREVGNRSAIDLADGTWYTLNLASDGTGATVTVQMLWQTGADPASEARACGHPLNQKPPAPPATPNPPGTANPSFRGSKAPIVYSGDSPYTGTSFASYDNDLNTTWFSGRDYRPRASLTVDLGATRDVSGVKWKFHTLGFADQFTVVAVNEAGQSRTLGQFGNAPSAQTFHGVATYDTVYARYVVFTFTNVNNDASLGSISELEVWARTSSGSKPIPGSNPRFSGGALPITNSFGTANANGSSRAHDGNTDTSWYTTSTASPSQAILTVDIGSVQSLSGIRWMYRLSGGADRMRLQISTDNASWTQLVTTSNASKEPTTIETPALPSTADRLLDGIGVISYTGGDGANCRVSPDLDGDVIVLLPEQAEVVLKGALVDGWQPVTCAGQPGYVFADFVTNEGSFPSKPTQAPGVAEQGRSPTTVVNPEAGAAEPIPTAAQESQNGDTGASPEVLPPGAASGQEAEPTTVPTAVPTAAPSPTPAPTEMPTPEPQLIRREIEIASSADASVSQAEPDAAQSGESMLSLPAGGASGAIAVITFQVEGIAEGTVVDAQLVLIGNGGESGAGGELIALPGVWMDESSATWNSIMNLGGWSAGWVDWVQPGVQSVVDVTGVVSGDGYVTFVIMGTPEQPIALGSSEGGAPAYLVITIEEWVTPSP